LKLTTPVLIVNLLITMLSAVQFHNQDCIRTYEIDYVAPYSVLPPELPTHQAPVSQSGPQQLFGVGRINS
jgi:hypothetical protein